MWPIDQSGQLAGSSIAAFSIDYGWLQACLLDGGVGAMLRIQRSENGEVVFTLSGQMDETTIAELEILINSEANGRRIILDLKDLMLVDENAVLFLERYESNSITLQNCPPYVREWINRQRQVS